MTAYEASLLARARDLADEAAELGDAVAVTILGGARAAGLDPDAYAPLTGAALALGADRVSVYRAGAPACPSDAAFLAAVADAEDDARDLLTAAGALAETVTAALDAALADADDAADAAEAAEDDKDDHDAAERAALCEETLGVLGELETRLRHAIARLQAVPVVLGETYESVYSLIRSGGRMPLEGRWVTGEDRAAAWPAVPAMTGRRTGPVRLRRLRRPRRDSGLRDRQDRAPPAPRRAARHDGGSRPVSRQERTAQIRDITASRIAWHAKTAAAGHAITWRLDDRGSGYAPASSMRPAQDYAAR